MIYFHNKIWNHWVIYSYFGVYIRHYTPVALLLCCDNIKDWSMPCTTCGRPASKTYKSVCRGYYKSYWMRIRIQRIFKIIPTECAFTYSCVGLCNEILSTIVQCSCSHDLCGILVKFTITKLSRSKYKDFSYLLIFFLPCDINHYPIGSENWFTDQRFPVIRYQLI